jgi:acyl-[acyl carrier protein]--UDP-N-acetylglucosamine O-acyltransferase
LGKDVEIGPNVIIGEHVIVGDRTKIEANVLVEKWTRIGADNHIHFGCVLGSDPQDGKYKGERSWVVIGDRNIIREYVTINRATGKNETTEIGSDVEFEVIGTQFKQGDEVIIVVAKLHGEVEHVNNVEPEIMPLPTSSAPTGDEMQITVVPGNDEKPKKRKLKRKEDV